MNNLNPNLNITRCAKQAVYLTFKDGQSCTYRRIHQVSSGQYGSLMIYLLGLGLKRKFCKDPKYVPLTKVIFVQVITVGRYAKD